MIDDLENLNDNVIRALEAKAWGVISGGAGFFEIQPTYNDSLVVMDSLFFNNYGIRTFDGVEFVSWNWAAPFRIGKL